MALVLAAAFAGAAPAAAAAKAPAVSAVAPASGPTAGGTRVTITGTGFTHVKSVVFGKTAGRSLTVASATKLLVTSPKGAAGVVNIGVTTSAGTSKIVKADRFTFVAPPTITTVSPASGTTAGGQQVTVTGSGFSGIRSATFGGAAGSKLTIVSTTKLTVTSPKHAAGKIDIQVTGPYGTSANTTRDDYSFVKPAPASAWSPAAMPYTNAFGPHSGAGIAGVSCPAAASCVAVGEVFGDSNNPLIETLADGTWTGRVLPQVGTDTSGYLTAVSCPSITACVAVGRGVLAADGTAVIAETLSGGKWTASTLPTLAHGAMATINSIWCQSTTSCVAAGTSSAEINTPLIETLSGGHWTATSPPTLDGLSEGFLSGISCTSASACTAVGSADDPASPGTGVPLVETWNGTAWTPSSPPVADGAVNGSLSAVSCPAGGYCTAIGTDDASRNSMLIEQQSATGWTPSKPALATGHSGGQLVSVSCATATTCTAVGGDTVPNGGGSTRDLPLTETLSRGTWMPDNPPVPQSSDGFLKAVSCTGATSCIAVGNRAGAGSGQIFSDTRA